MIQYSSSEFSKIPEMKFSSYLSSFSIKLKWYVSAFSFQVWNHFHFRCIKLQFGGEAAQAEAWAWLAASQLSSVITTKESRYSPGVHPTLGGSAFLKAVAVFLSLNGPT